MFSLTRLDWDRIYFKASQAFGACEQLLKIIQPSRACLYDSLIVDALNLDPLLIGQW